MSPNLELGTNFYQYSPIVCSTFPLIFCWDNFAFFPTSSYPSFTSSCSSPPSSLLLYLLHLLLFLTSIFSSSPTIFSKTFNNMFLRILNLICFLSFSQFIYVCCVQLCRRKFFMVRYYNAAKFRISTILNYVLECSTR